MDLTTESDSDCYCLIQLVANRTFSAALYLCWSVASASVGLIDGNAISPESSAFKSIRIPQHQKKELPMKLSAFALISLILPCVALSAPEVDSREYKLLLKPTLFTHGTADAVVADYFADFAAAVEATIARDVTGTMSLDKIRTVRFFDTPGSCQLNNLGYIFRERIENGDSEVTLKFRSADPYIADFEDLSAASSQAETKLESDFGVKNGNPLHIVYGHSTKTPNKRNLNDLEDINVHFPGFADDYNFSNSTPLAVVGQLAVHERVYKGGEIDLGSIDAEVSITLWYHSLPATSQQPVIAEVSFKYEDSSANYTKAVVNRAKLAFEAMQTLTALNSSSSVTKTQFVYSYQPDFCN